MYEMVNFFIEALKKKKKKKKKWIQKVFLNGYSANNYFRFGSKDATYQAYWSTPVDFQNILISNLMLQDHFPDALMRALQKILPDDIVEIENTSNDENGSTSINISPGTVMSILF